MASLAATTGYKAYWHLQGRRADACDRQLYEGPLGFPPLGSITHLHLLDIRPKPRFSGDEISKALLILAHLTLLEVEGEITTEWAPAASVTSTTNPKKTTRISRAFLFSRAVQCYQCPTPGDLDTA